MPPLLRRAVGPPFGDRKTASEARAGLVVALVRICTWCPLLTLSCGSHHRHTCQLARPAENSILLICSSPSRSAETASPAVAWATEADMRAPPLLLPRCRCCPARGGDNGDWGRGGVRGPCPRALMPPRCAAGMARGAELTGWQTWNHLQSLKSPLLTSLTVFHTEMGVL